MAVFEMSTAPSFLQTSLQQLNAITNEAYNEQIRPVALGIWQKHMRPENPQWKFITAKPFSLNNKSGSAHIMTMVDERLPDIGIVGYFACTNSAVGAKVLKQAANWLKKENAIKNAYGPINGTLPSDYRLNLNDDFRFPGEPVNPTWHIDAFRLAGFETYNHYISAKAKHYQLIMKLVKRKPPQKYAHLKVRPFDTKHHKRDFKIYHELRNAIFPFQSIYCPAISLEERIYNSTGKFDPNYAYFLVDNGREIGFVMAYVHENELVLKTIGLLPEYQGKKLSGLLLRPVHDQASRAGLTAAIYGMIRVGNTVSKSRRPGVKAFRKYVTMHKKL
jgi:hypothetical protein